MDQPRRNRISRWVMVLALAAGGGMGGTAAWGQVFTAADNSTVMGTTLPSQRLELSFDGPGIIGEVQVKEGDTIQKGQELMAEDDRMEEKLYEAMRMDADSDLPIQFAQKTLSDSQTKLKRFKGMGSSASPFEVLEAELDVALSEIKVQQAQQEQKQKKLQADRQKIKVDLMHLKSPIDGLVEKLNLGLGEVVDPNKPSCTVVKNDPLWVEIHLPSRQAAELATGDTLPVQEDGKKLWADAKVIFLSPVADAASGTRLVRLAMPNPTGVPSGLQVLVKLPQKLLSASATTDAR
jgi:RND family efflux transporter MFP subunit